MPKNREHSKFQRFQVFFLDFSRELNHCWILPFPISTAIKVLRFSGLT